MGSRYLWLLTVTILARGSNARICRSVDARNNVTALEILRGCTVVEGCVQIVLMTKSFEEADFEPYSFPELREITQYLLFYRVNALRSLGKLFPNLEKIGGDNLFSGFALVIYEMSSLREIGFTNLREISRGSVNIVKNQMMCFVDTVRWSKITPWRVHLSDNRDVDCCPGCPTHCRDNGCWNTTHCQVESGVINGYTCEGVFDLDDKCVNDCPANTLRFHNRRCITREDCISTALNDKETPTNEAFPNVPQNYIIHENQCLKSCPSGYTFNAEWTGCNPCSDGLCVRWCKGAEINIIGDAEKLKGCTHINGSIEITIKNDTSRAALTVLEETLGSIEEITGHLKVTRSSLIDLNFFKNLSVIRGEDENKRNFSLVIIDNENLQELWNWEVKRNITVQHGKRLYFHYNPKLCLQQIYRLLDVINYEKSVSNFEIDKESNGDKFPCNAIHMNITDIDKSIDTIEVRIPYMIIDQKNPVLRYVIFYTKDPFKNITMFDELDQCSDYGWKTTDISVADPDDLYYKAHGIRFTLTDLEPDMNYVFYVTTYTIYNVGARSGLHYVKTLPTKPSELTRLHAYSNNSSEVSLQWEPPKHVNGKLKEYIVTWYALKEERDFIEQRNYCDYPPVNEIEINQSQYEQLDKVRNNSCCLAPRPLPKEVFEMCGNFPNAQFPIGLPDKMKYLSCKSYFYSYVYSNPFQFNNEVGKNSDIHTAPPKHITETSINTKLRQIKHMSTLQNHFIDTNQQLKINQDRKTKRILFNSSGVIIGNLTPFQNYVFSVKACRERDPTENDTLDDNRCSISEIVTVRTKANETADIIPPHSIKFEFKKETLVVYWSAPEIPNGLIVAFEIAYRHRDTLNSNFIVECLTYTQYKNNKHKHEFDHLTPGNYEFKIRAVSLFGKGPFSNFHNFEVEGPMFSPLWIAVVVLLVTALLALVFIYSYFSKPSKYRVIADVNPNYHYVTDHYEIDRYDVKFCRELGTGSFGKVYEGLVKSTNLRCAIKTVNENATKDNENEFLSEATVMKSMTDAYFIVKLLGVVSKGRPPLVLMELMEEGDLKTYLRSIRNKMPLTNATMIRMAMEIADAMAFMEAHKFIHRDLAARNCMVNSDLTIKVGDFGMARDIYETDYYRKINKGLLPIRWMAPESLKDGEFTSQSDIWSYGVVLWEVITMAEQPYQGSTNDQVLQEVMAGRRLGIPKSSPLPMRNLMMMCWRTKPQSRTSFMHIVGTLAYYHDEEFKEVAYYYSKGAENIRKGLWEYVDMLPVDNPLIGRSNENSLHQTTTH